MDINRLPVECLMKIFSHLSSYKEVLLVSKYFYDVACRVNYSSNCLTLDNWFFEKENHNRLLQSIKHSNQKISKLVIKFDNLTEMQNRSMMHIVEKFTSTINYFKIRRATLNMADFLEILALLPNVVHLVVYKFTLRTENQPMTNKRKKDNSTTPGNEYKYLHQLKTLELIGKGYENEVFVVLNTLATVSLTELRLKSMWYVKHLVVLMKRQANIKNLTITEGRGYWTDRSDYTNFFDNLKLETLELSPIYTNFETILSKQTKLKSLKLNYQAKPVLMNIVMNQLPELETLKLVYAEIGVLDIGNLKKLKDLTLEGITSESLVYFTTLDNSRITRLDILSYQLTDDLNHDLAKSAPNIKVLRLRCQNAISLNAILRNFNFVEVIQIFVTLNTSNIDNDWLQGDCFNSKLIQLGIYWNLLFGTPLLNKLIANYPNLKTLAIKSRKPFTATQFQLLLNGFPKMESMNLIRGASKLTSDDLQYLRQMKKLKFVSFGDLNCTLRDGIEESDLFNVITVDNFDVVNMAVDQHEIRFGEKNFSFPQFL